MGFENHERFLSGCIGTACLWRGDAARARSTVCENNNKTERRYFQCSRTKDPMRAAPGAPQ